MKNPEDVIATALFLDWRGNSCNNAGRMPMPMQRGTPISGYVAQITAAAKDHQAKFERCVNCTGVEITETWLPITAKS